MALQSPVKGLGGIGDTWQRTVCRWVSSSRDSSQVMGVQKEDLPERGPAQGSWDWVELQSKVGTQKRKRAPSWLQFCTRPAAHISLDPRQQGSLQHTMATVTTAEKHRVYTMPLPLPSYLISGKLLKPSGRGIINPTNQWQHYRRGL